MYGCSSIAYTNPSLSMSYKDIDNSKKHQKTILISEILFTTQSLTITMHT